MSIWVFIYMRMDWSQTWTTDDV